MNSRVYLGLKGFDFSIYFHRAIIRWKGKNFYEIVHAPIKVP
jgi:hypothetical protein